MHKKINKKDKEEKSYFISGKQQCIKISRYKNVLNNFIFTELTSIIINVLI